MLIPSWIEGTFRIPCSEPASADCVGSGNERSTVVRLPSVYIILEVELMLHPGSLAANHAAKLAFIADLYNRPIAIEQDKANEQHYEVPTAFLQLCLGPRMKYSSCIWETPKSGLSDAEDAILSSYCVDARLGKGLRRVGAASHGAGTSDIRGKQVEVKEWEAGKEGEGLRILDLGCGWGSLGLFLAEVSASGACD